MKNIHLIPTDKPSRLYIGDNGNFVFGMIKTSIQSKNDDFTNQNIYITSDEKIKEGDWACHKNITNDKYQIIKCNVSNKESIQEHWNKIILTTDVDLIKDGVQAIDDGFLEWFVKNPSCEYVEVEKIEGRYVDYGGNVHSPIRYRILVTEPKQVCEYCKQTISEYGCACGKQEEPKQETIEEVDENKKNLYYYKQVMNPYPVEEYSHTVYEKGFIEGYQESTKLQQERRYSEEEVNEIIAEAWNSCEDNEGETFTEARKRIIEQFKKK